jgi:DNA polymerase-3 subunit epsilon
MELLFLDTETGGVDPFRHSLLQIGMVAYVNGEIKDSMSFYIKDETYKIEPEAMKINGLDLETINKIGKPKGLLTAMEVANFLKLNFKSKPTLVGHNITFDKYFVREFFLSVNLDMDDFISYRLLDTASLARGLKIAKKLHVDKVSLKELSSYFGIENEKEHDALSDCVATVKVYEKLIELMKG